MAQNVTVAGASYSDVPAVELPKTGGGTATFYDADFKTVTKTLTNITSSADETRVENGNSFYCELTPTSGYVISSITVTMGGVDITDQVFKAGTGAKTITANGTYSAASDNLSGYTAVSVNVPSGSASLGTKSITSNGTYNASSDGYDGYSQVTVSVSGGTPTGTKNISITSNGTTTEDVTNYATASITANVPNSYTSSDEGKVVSNGALVSQGSDTVTTNGTVDTTLINSLTVSVPSMGATNFVQGTFTTNSSSGVQSVTINYSGNGYPIAACIYVDGGMRNTSNAFYNLIKRYALAVVTIVKAVIGTTPTYGTSGAENQGIVQYVYKNSTSNANNYGAGGNTTANTYTSSNANSTVATTARFTAKNSLSIYVADSSYGFAPSTTYHYDIIYSA